jgi:hypothetical protein
MNDVDDVTEWPPKILTVLEQLWKDGGIQQVFTKGDQLNVQDTAA